MQPVPPAGPAGSAAAPLHRMAFDYLREVLSRCSGDAPLPPAAPASGGEPRGLRAPAGPAEAARRREWSRGWRRLRLPDELAAYARELEAARTAEHVYAAVPAHAARMVGAFTCLLFLPRPGAREIRPLPDGRLRAAAEAMRIPRLRGRRRVTAADAVPPAARFAGLAPLFQQDGAASLACAPFGGRGALVLVERRRDRVFGAADWELLSLLAALGEAALRRVQAAPRIPHLDGTCPVTGLAGRGQVAAALEHAWEVVAQGEPMSVVVVSLEGPAAAEACFGPRAAERLLRTAAEALRECLPPDGMALRHGPAEFVLALPGCTPAAAAAVVGQLRRRLALPLEVHAGIAGDHPGAGGPHDLLHGALASLSPRPREDA